MNNQTVSRISIVLLAIVLLVFGAYHFMKPQNLVGYIPSFLPGGIIWIYLTGAAFILAAIAFITNKMVRIAGYMLALLLFIFVLTMHLPNFMNSGSNDLKQMALVNLLKDTALAAFALHIGANAKS